MEDKLESSVIRSLILNSRFANNPNFQFDDITRQVISAALAKKLIMRQPQYNTSSRVRLTLVLGGVYAKTRYAVGRNPRSCKSPDALSRRISGLQERGSLRSGVRQEPLFEARKESPSKPAQSAQRRKELSLRASRSDRLVGLLWSFAKLAETQGNRPQHHALPVRRLAHTRRQGLQGHRPARFRSGTLYRTSPRVGFYPNALTGFTIRST
jgi:hypothetical protein